MKAYNIDAELMPIVEVVPDLGFDDPIAARAGMEGLIQLLNSDIDESGVDYEDTTIAGPEGSGEIHLRIYRPAKKEAGPAGMLYIHGGGFAVGNLESEHGAAISLCRDLGIPIVSVDYRLAPEHPYPAGLEDCYTTLEWMHTNCSKLKIDPQRIAIFGQSAGGGLSAGLALLAKQRGGPAICFQFLGIPEVDDRLETVSMTEFDDTPMWSRPNAVLSWQYYLGKDYDRDNVPITASPARAGIDELRGLPPACITTMEFDPLRDEGISYALKLLQAGVSVELHSYPGTFHGSSLVPGARISQREQADVRSALRRALQLED